MAEIWKEVLNSLYEVSSLGRVRSKTHRSGDGRQWKGRILKIFPIPRYPSFISSIDGKRRNRTVHTLVAKAFLGPPPKGKTVNHKDGNKLNNKISNLEYVTPKQNSEHAKKKGLMPTKTNGRWRRRWRP